MGGGFQQDPACPSPGWEEASFSPSSPSRPSFFPPPSSDAPASLSLSISLSVLSSPLSIPASRISLPFLLPPPRFPHPRAPFSPDPHHLQAQGCIPAELSLRGSAAPPSGQSRDRSGVSHTRKTRVLLCLLQKTQRCPPTWPAPSIPSAARSLGSGYSGSTLTSISAPPLSPLTTLITRQTLLLKEETPELMCFNSRIPSPFTAGGLECRHPEDASVLCSPGREGPTGAQLSRVCSRVRLLVTS